MYRINQMKGRRGGTTRNLGLLASIVLIAACSETATHPSEELGQAQDTLLAAACTVNTVTKAVTMTVGAGEVAYVGKVAGCTTEPCVFVNALNAGGSICRFDTTAYTIAVGNGGAGLQKLVLDYTNGLFSLATSGAVPVATNLLAGSTVMVVAPATGANMALGTLAGVHGLDLNTLVASRPLPFVDVTMATGTNFFFNGGAGKDVFTADPDGWTTPPTGWDTAAHLSGVVGLASTLAVTASGGANDDTLAGGAGVNTLLGGAGNDTFLQSKNAAAESISGGDGIDTVDYGVRAAPVYASVGANAGVATVSVAAAGTTYLVGDVLTIAGSKVNPATVTVQTIGALGIITAVTVTTGGSGYAASVGNATTTNSVAGSGATITVATLKGDDGAVGEFDDVQADVEIVKGGAGSDVLSAYPIVTTDVVLIGNAGNDKLTGGAGNDDLCGGAGDDTFYDNAGNDNIVGGIGLDTIDYSAAPNPVFACLNVADTVAGKTCATQNGGKIGDKDLVNATLAKVCPRATLNVGLAAGGTAVVAVPAASQGAAMAVDVENLTGHATAVNTLACGTLACTLFGGSGDDFLYGGAAQDLIFGMGGADHVTSGGANDVIDLTHGGGAKVQTVDCGSNQVTLLISAADVAGKVLTACTAANMP